jgi:hypothetical protein
LAFSQFFSAGGQDSQKERNKKFEVVENGDTPCLQMSLPYPWVQGTIDNIRIYKARIDYRYMGYTILLPIIYQYY